MRDRVLVYAIGISLMAHLAAVCVIGHSSASRLSTPPIFAKPRFINVDLINEPKSDPAKPPQAPVVSKPMHAPDPPPEVVAPTPSRVRQPSNSANHANRTQPGARPTHALPGNPGGGLNTGTPSRNGDLPGMGNSGKTPVGWVPGDEHGSGQGSGNGAGVGTPDPPKHADPGTGTKPAPAPAPPPVQMVSAKICTVSGDLAGKWCDHTKNESYVEGHQPRNTCDRCKEPVHINRTADRANPELVTDSRPDIPSSVEEGLSVKVEISYTVTAEGGVKDIEVTKSSGVRAIDKAVTSSASRLKYKPAVQDGIPRSVKKTRNYVVNT